MQFDAYVWFDRTSAVAALPSARRRAATLAVREVHDDYPLPACLVAQDLIRRQPGIVATRVGYSGGDVPNATYRNHGTHAEAIEITFDPANSYRDIL